MRNVPTIIAGPLKWTKDQQAKFEVRAEAQGPVEVIICGHIGEDYWDESAMSEQKFNEALKGYETSRDLIVNVNSMGGSVKDGLGIYNAIKRWPGKTTARISGFAVSIASVIPLACDRVISPKSSNWMIHDPLCMTAGNSADHQKSIEMLESCASTMAAIYAEKTGKSRSEMRKIMQAETWFTGEEAKSMGLADEVNDDEPSAINRAQLDSYAETFSEFRNVPQRLAAILTKPKPPTSAGQTKQDTMNKAAILALLLKHGKNISADANDEAILAALADLVTTNKITQPEADQLKVPATPIVINNQELTSLKEQLRREREARLTSEFNIIAIDRPYLKAAEWMPTIMADESQLMRLKAMPVISLPGADPLAAGVQNLGNSMIESYRKMAPGADRMKFSIENWNGLEDAHSSARIQAMSSLPVSEQLRRLHSPRAANSYSATLVTDRLADATITTIGTKLAALRGFSRDFGVDPMKPKATVQVRRVTTTSAVQTNPTNFETGDTTTTAASVTVDQISKSFHATNDELNKGHLVQAAAEKNSQTFANAISDVVTGVMTLANFGAGTAIGAAATFDASDLAPIYALAKNYGSKNLILDGGHLAYLLPTDKFKFRLGEEGAYNFDLIAEQNRWTGAIANTVGFICDPNAIAVASGLPASLPSGEFIELNTVTVPALGLSILLTHWFSRGGRVHWMAYDVMFGAIAGDTTAGEVLVSA